MKNMNMKKGVYMPFSEAWLAMLAGHKVKLPHWDGYWAWEDGTIMMHCRDGSTMDVRSTPCPVYTFSNIASNDWMIAD